MDNSEVSYYLVLELRRGDFMPIDINIINNNKYIDYRYLQNIDNFTKNYSEFEIREMIRINNLVPNEYLSGKLIIMNQNRYRYPLFSKEKDYSFPRFLYESIDDKQIMNKFMNIYLKYQKENYINMKHAIITKDINMILNLLSRLSYEQIRKIYMYVDEKIIFQKRRLILENEIAA